jgi:hypothetical protein
MTICIGNIGALLLYYKSLRIGLTLLSKGLKAWIYHMEYTMTCSIIIMYYIFYSAFMTI